MEKPNHIRILTGPELEQIIHDNAKTLAQNYSLDDLTHERSTILRKYREYLEVHPDDTVTTQQRKDFRVQLETYTKAIQIKTPKKSN